MGGSQNGGLNLCLAASRIASRAPQPWLAKHSPTSRSWRRLARAGWATSDGRVKVLDFGLARTEPVIASDIDSESPTELKSQESVLEGTAHYMSPEQAQGKKVDARSDIFSLGIVLYEMLAGRRPFEGEPLTEVLSSIIKDTPPAARELRPEISPELSRLVMDGNSGRWAGVSVDRPRRTARTVGVTSCHRRRLPLLHLGRSPRRHLGHGRRSRRRGMMKQGSASC